MSVVVKVDLYKLMLNIGLCSVLLVPGSLSAEVCWTNAALRELVDEALQGNADAECEVGRRYAEIATNDDSALAMQAYYWYWNAADHGSEEASRQLSNTCWTSIETFLKNRAVLQEAHRKYLF